METYIKMCEYYETDPTDILRQAYPNTIYSDIDYLKYIPPHIRKVIEAYLDQSEMQPAVDKLLGIEDTDKTEDLSLIHILNMIAVGNQIVNQLEAAGIKTIHDTNVYDSPAYTGAYSRSAKTIQDYLNQYPSIQVVLDIHRDSMTQDDGTKIKPTVDVYKRQTL